MKYEKLKKLFLSKHSKGHIMKIKNGVSVCFNYTHLDDNDKEYEDKMNRIGLMTDRQKSNKRYDYKGSYISIAERLELIEKKKIEHTEIKEEDSIFFGIDF
ncbi:MAG: hypothetical protein ACOC1K_07715 [Nanoarchaeota archaeon]